MFNDTKKDGNLTQSLAGFPVEFPFFSFPGAETGIFAQNNFQQPAKPDKTEPKVALLSHSDPFPVFKPSEDRPVPNL